MALKAELEELLKVMAPADAVAQRAIFEKHPNLAEGYLRQADYDRNMNQLKDRVKKADTWDNWAERNLDRYNEIKEKYPTLESERDTLKAEVDRLKAEVEKKVAASIAASGGDPANIDAIVSQVMNKIGGDRMTKAEANALIATQVKEAAAADYGEARKNFYEKDVPQFASWITGMVDAQSSYREETGKKLDRAEFAKFMTDNKISDPQTAYERFMEPVRRKTEIEAEAKKRADEMIAEAKRNGEFPGTSGSPSPQGGLQVRLQKRDANDPLFKSDVEIGDNASAMAAAAELRSEGKL